MLFWDARHLRQKCFLGYETVLVFPVAMRLGNTKKAGSQSLET